MAGGVAYEAHAAMWLALMEAPALLSATWLARRGAARQPGGWRHMAHEVASGPSVVLLVGGLTVGALLGPQGLQPLDAVFRDPFKGALALFLLELGIVVGGRLRELRQFGLRLLAVGVMVPPALALAGAAAGVALGLSAGGVALLATLAGSASYIAAPTAMRLALPEANHALSITASLAITFPFNVVLGIPMYVGLARALT